MAFGRAREFCDVEADYPAPARTGAFTGDEMLRMWHIALGGFAVLLGALQLWQDWRLSDQELANHSQ